MHNALASRSTATSEHMPFDCSPRRRLRRTDGRAGGRTDGRGWWQWSISQWSTANRNDGVCAATRGTAMTPADGHWRRASEHRSTHTNYYDISTVGRRGWPPIEYIVTRRLLSIRHFITPSLHRCHCSRDDVNISYIKCNEEHCIRSSSKRDKPRACEVTKRRIAFMTHFVKFGDKTYPR